MSSKKSLSTGERPSRLDRALRVAWRKISPSRGTSPSKNDERDESHFAVEAQDVKGALGLNLLHDPPNPKIDFVFVHGLGGGSRKTWTSLADPKKYWPGVWLPQDPEFSSVRIHSFGYNADLTEWRNNDTLNILDFARSLLGEMSCNTGIRRSNTKIVLIGHSMGGIVIKKAYMLAREDAALRSFASRIHTLYFLGTPHSGSDYSKALATVLAVSYGQKTFVSELNRDSTTIATINDSFRHYANDLQLWSFYETVPTKHFGVQVIIVDAASATLRLHNESCRPLNADHHGICKFPLENDPNYRTLRSCFITSIDKISTEYSMALSHAKAVELEQLSRLSGIHDVPDEELLAREDIRAPGTCEWLTKRQSYTSWQETPNGELPFFWLTGNAGAGKSILTNHIATHLQRSKLKCSHFFFKNGNSQKSSLAMCLRSLANQMARTDAQILRELLKVQPSQPSWESWDEKKLWQKLFVDRIFKVSNLDVHYWVIDSIDECQKSDSLLNLLKDVPLWLKVFFTSRSSFKNAVDASTLAGRFEYYQMQNADTLADVKIFMDTKIAWIPVSGEQGREEFKQAILEKASGSFLWVALVMRLMAKAYSKEAAAQILEEVPTDMNSLYSGMLGTMIKDRHAVVLAKSLFMWTLLSSRPLKIAGLQTVLKLDTDQTVNDLERHIPSFSGQIVTVNKYKEAEVIHLTAKSYLLQQEEHPELVIDKLKCHTKMAKICLGILAELPIHSQWPGSSSQLNPDLSTAAPDLVDYACEHFSDHLQRSSAEDDRNWDLLCKFLDCNNVLDWIEFLARKRHMHSVTRTAQNLRSYFRRRLKHLKYLPQISDQKPIVEYWIHDLFRLSAKFGSGLTLCPSSIHTLIPSMCPSESNISKFKTDTFSTTGFSIKGIMDSSWDDCLARIDYPNRQTSAVACGDQYSVVALTNGSLCLYYQDSGQLKTTLNHCARANVLLFSDKDRYLASSGQRKVKVWDPTEGVLLWEFETKHQILNLSFMDKENVLTGASQGGHVLRWNLRSGEEQNRWQWTDTVRGDGVAKRSWPQPSKAVFSPDHKFLAVYYRGLPLHLFNLSSRKFAGLFTREFEAGPTSAVNVEAVAFNQGSDINSLVVSYADGELVFYDIKTKELRYQRPDVFAHCLKCSPNGRTLVTGSSNGAIQIFELDGARGERALPLYTINAQEDGIRDIAVSSDSIRFSDIRGSQYRVWEPAVLSCSDLDDNSQSDLSNSESMEIRPVGIRDGQVEPEITAIHSSPGGDFVFCGKRDGSVSYFDTRTATYSQVLYRHALDISITCIIYVKDKQLLVTADESGRVLINKVTASDTGFEFHSHVNDIRSEQSLFQLLHDISGTRILLRGKNSTEIWTTEGMACEVTLSTDGESLLDNHPSRPGYLVALGRHATSIFSWEDGQNTAISLQSKHDVDLMVTPPTPIKGSFGFADEGFHQCEEPWAGPYFAQLHRHDPRDPPKYNGTTDMIKVWPASSIPASTGMTPSLPLEDFARHSNRVRQIIAISGNVLYFLDTDLWICSLGIMNSSTISSGAKRHFFLLSEWRSLDGGFLIEYLPATHEFVVSKKHELLVIIGGLEFEEPWV